MFTRYIVLLTKIIEELKTKTSIDEVDEELFAPIQTMLEILEGLDKGSHPL